MYLLRNKDIGLKILNRQNVLTLSVLTYSISLKNLKEELEYDIIKL